MVRFFFDVSSTDYAHYDFRGREFAKLDDARELAELIALDLGCADDGHGLRLEVQVRNVTGERLFCIPVPQHDLVAA